MADQLQRIDSLLVGAGLSSGRDRAKELIEAGLVTADGAVVSKPSQKFPSGTQIVVLKPHKYVSRGGEKLEYALKTFAIDPNDAVCIDIGASTGGFTDCLLQNRAKLIYAVDTGSNQLAEKLRNDSRVICFENCDIRSLSQQNLGQIPQIAVCDVSFISLSLIFPSAYRLLSPDGMAIFLIKPQFEVGRENVGKNGIVKQPKLHKLAIEKAIEAAKQNGFAVLDITHSNTPGRDGNIEFIAHLKKGGQQKDFDLDAIVEKAHSLLI